MNHRRDSFQELALQNKKAEEEQLEKERQQLAYEKKIRELQKKHLADARRKLRRAAEVCRHVQLRSSYFGATLF